jgi:rubrerythrin
MSIAFTPAELIRIAIEIEERGMTFYDVIAKSTDNAAAKKVFEELASMEREHVRIFTDMIADSQKYRLIGPPDEEYEGYLHSLIDSAVFTDDAITSEMATQADSDIKALELGISSEKDSILFYYQMKELMPPPAIEMIDGIIAEEKRHLWQLTEIKKRLQQAGE